MRWTSDGTTLDLDTSEVVRGGRSIALSPLEARLLLYLAGQPGQVISTQALLREVWGYHPRTQTRAVTKTLHRLRAKLEADPAHPRWLHTMRGKGVRFTPPRGTPAAVRPARPPMLGRTAEQSTLQAWSGGAGRLLTLLGPGGIGKTRLARWAADEAGERLLGFCELDGVHTRERLLERIAATLGIALSEASDGTAIAKHLRRQERPLLVLDNLEEAIDAASPLVAGWLQQSNVQIMVTSRRRLQLPEETVVLLPSLTPEASTALLASRGGWPQDAALRSLAVALEGIPLALELAAAHGPLLPPAVVESRLASLLAAPRTANAARHRTIAAAVGWSWQQLSAEEQTALARLSVCGGPVSLDAAETLLDRPDALELLLSLVEHSLLWWEGTSLAMYNVIRHFARQHIRDEDADEALARLGWFAAEGGLAAREAAGIGRGDEALEALVSMPALLAAWDAALRGSDATLLCWLAYLIGQLRFGRMHPARIRADLRTALARPGAAPEARSRARYVLARSAALVGDYDVAAAHFADVLADTRARGDRILERITLCAIVQHHQPGRDRLADAKAAVAACAGDEARMLPVALMLLGLVHQRQGSLDEAAEAYRRADQMFEAHQQQLGVLRLLCLRAGMPMRRAQREELVARLRHWSVPPTDSTGAMVWTTLGHQLILLGEAEEARYRLETASAHHQRSGDHIDQIATTVGRGVASLLLGEPDTGNALLEEALTIAEAIESYQTPFVRGRLGIARLMSGRLEEGSALFRASDLPPAWQAVFLLVARSPEAPPAETLTDPDLSALLANPADPAVRVALSQRSVLGQLVLKLLDGWDTPARD